MKRKWIIFLALLFLASRSLAATFYVDYSGGNDANAGTSTNAPWKHCPQMRGWSGVGYTAQAGDRFLFKGSVTWPNAALPLYINFSGASGNSNYWGVDNAWFSGGSWSMPVFDAESTAFGQGQSPHPSSRDNIFWFKSCSYGVVDGIEMKNFLWRNIVSTSESDSWAVYCDQANHVTMKNCYIHDWVVQTTADKQFGGMGSYSSTYLTCHSNYIRAPSYIDPVYKTDLNGFSSGSPSYGLSTFTSNVVIGTTYGAYNPGSTVKWNLMMDGGQSFDSAKHEAGYWIQNQSTVAYNHLSNWVTGVGGWFYPCWSGPGRTQWVHDNIFERCPQISLSNERATDTNGHMYFFNNVIATPAGRVRALTDTSGASKMGVTAIQNNVFIHDNTNNYVTVDLTDIVQYTNSNNALYLTAEAAALGMTSERGFEPSSSIPDLLDQGVDYSGHIDPDTDYLGFMRLAPWDIGPYEFTGGTGGEISVVSAAYAVNEGAGSLQVALRRSGGVAGAVTVDYTTADGTAVEPGDYTASSGTVQWNDQDGTDKFFQIFVIDDGDDESDETFTFEISNATGGATLGSPTVTTITITDDDPPNPEQFLSMSSLIYICWENIETLPVGVSRTGASTGTVTVDYTTVDGTARAGTDYTATSGTLTFADGVSSKLIYVRITDDALLRASRAFTIHLSNPTGATIGTEYSTITILDDEVTKANIRSATIRNATF